MGRDLTRRRVIELGLGAWGLGLVTGLGCGDGDSGEDADTGPVSSCEVEISGNHGHSLNVPAAHVQAGTGRTYTLSTGDGHQHDAVLSEIDFERLQTDGETRIETSSVAGHKHFVTVTCS